MVSGKYVTTENIKLGSWIGRQRKDYKANKLSKEKIVLLEQIGMVWSVYDTNWYENYALVKNYIENKGNCKCQYLNVGKVENKNVGFSTYSSVF